MQPLADTTTCSPSNSRSLYCMRNSKTVGCQRPRQHIFVKSVEQEELPLMIDNIVLRKTSERFWAARFICLSCFRGQNGRDRRIHARSCDLSHAFQIVHEKHNSEHAPCSHPKPQEDR